MVLPNKIIKRGTQKKGYLIKLSCTKTLLATSENFYGHLKFVIILQLFYLRQRYLRVRKGNGDIAVTGFV